MRSYEVARTLFSFLAFCAWSIVVVGGLVALIGAGGGSRYGGAGAGLLAMVPGLSIGIAGLLLVAFVQIGRATVDTAEYSQQMLKVARDQLDVSKQGLKQDQALSQSFAALRQPASTPKTAGYANADQETDVPNKEEIKARAPTDVKITKLPRKNLAPIEDQNGFLLLNDRGTLLEFRGRKFGYVGGKYDLEGQEFTSARTLKRYLNGLKDLSS